jgi:hypothetical protein
MAVKAAEPVTLTVVTNTPGGGGGGVSTFVGEKTEDGVDPPQP